MIEKKVDLWYFYSRFIPLRQIDYVVNRGKKILV